MASARAPACWPGCPTRRPAWTDVIYLDNAATTFPKPPGTLELAVERYRELGVSPGRGNHDLAMRASDAVEAVRAQVAAFFGAPDAERVVFGANATDALNTA